MQSIDNLHLCSTEILKQNLPVNCTVNLNDQRKINSLIPLSFSTEVDSLDNLNIRSLNNITSAEDEHVSVSQECHRDINGNWLCPACCSSFTRRQNMVRHAERICGITIPKTRPRTNCLYPDCDATFYFKTQLIEHMAQKHNNEVHCEILTFDSVPHFLEWKEAEEAASFTMFAKTQTVRCKNTGQLQYEAFVCHFDCHSGVQMDKAVRRCVEQPDAPAHKKSRVQFKTGKLCTARIMAYYNSTDEPFQVKYYKSHTHPLRVENTQFQRLSSRLKRVVSNSLAQGLPSQLIQSQLLHGQSDCSTAVGEPSSESSCVVRQRHLVSLRQIQKVRTQMIRGQPELQPVREEELLATHRLISRLCVTAETSVSHDPVLYYLTPCMPLRRSASCSHLQAVWTPPPDAFVLILQTSLQLQLYRHRAGMLLVLEPAHCATDDTDYSVLLLVVADESSRAAPAAMLLTNCLCEEAVQELLQSVQALSPEVQPRYVATDSCSRGITAARQVFTAAPLHHFINHWQLVRAWRRQMAVESRTQSAAPLLLIHLNVILHERDAAKLNIHCNAFQDRYRDAYPVFVQWFYRRFMRHRLQDWAMAFRPAWLCRLDSMLHRRPSYLGLLKVFYGQQRRHQRVDDLLSTLLRMDTVAATADEQIDSIADSHSAGLRLQGVDVRRANDCLPALFELSSSDVVGHKVQVTRVRGICQRDRCLNMCLSALCCGLCEHIYQCSCCGTQGLCAHIHRVHAAAVARALPTEVAAAVRLLAATERLRPSALEIAQGIPTGAEGNETAVPEATVEAEVKASESNTASSSVMLLELGQSLTLSNKATFSHKTCSNIASLVVLNDDDLQDVAANNEDDVLIEQDTESTPFFSFR